MSQSPPASGDQAQARLAPSPLTPIAANAPDIRAERASLWRELAFEALAPVEADAAATRLASSTATTQGRVVISACPKAAASFREPPLGDGQ
jgi:hypothetical protein